MHGRVKKDIVEPTPEELAKQTEMVKTAQALFKQLLAQREAKVYNAQMLDMTMKALMFHPEFPTLWGYRREILTSGGIEGDRKKMFEAEMKLLEKALRKSQKVYSIWFHRKWVIEKLFQTCASEAEANEVLDVELALCSKLLEVDERNFHCWNHRAFVMGLMLIQQQTPTSLPKPEVRWEVAAGRWRFEGGAPSARGVPRVPAVPSCLTSTWEVSSGRWQFKGGAAVHANTKDKGGRVDLIGLDIKLSKDLVNRNFSNYSAWHLRALLQQPVQGEPTVGGAGRELSGDQRIDVEEELEWVQQGIYTEPNDQSIWLYHHWLTVLGRGRERLRITHCAILESELFVFFSGPTCACREDAAGMAPVTVDVCTGNELEEAVCGDLVPMTSSAGARSHTRSLPSTRRRWATAWKFQPRVASESSQRSFSSQDLKEVQVKVAVEVLGTHATGVPAYGSQSLTYRGAPVLCNVQCPSQVSAALTALLAPELEPARATLIRSELEKVEELLEIEEDCKWAMLSRSRLAAMCAAGALDTKAVEESCADGYSRLCTLDPLRKGFYDEARAECLMRVRIISWLHGNVMSSPLDLSGLSLRHLSPRTTLAAFGVLVLDVSGNDLRELGPLLSLISLEELRASSNQLLGNVSEAFALPRLRCLDVSKNSMELRQNAAMISPPSSLKVVNMSSNPTVLALAASPASGAPNEPSTFAPPARNAGILERLLGAAEPAELALWELECDDATGHCVCRRGSK